MKKEKKGIMHKAVNKEPVIWENTAKKSAGNVLADFELGFNDILEAEKRLQRFAPLIEKLFPKTDDGIIESPLKEISVFKREVKEHYGLKMKGRLFLKCDSHLPVAGSIKARGGIYEVLCRAEELAFKHGFLSKGSDYSIIKKKRFQDLYSDYKLVVASSGNLGLSVGIMGRALGFAVDVHMSRDAKQWKKDLLQNRGANIIEYKGDFSEAVTGARRQSQNQPNAYFVDDEQSEKLFLGYSTAVLRLQKQLERNRVLIDQDHPLCVYLPCGVGGSPGGLTFGLKHIFKDQVRCYLIEPVSSCSMLLGILTGRYSEVHVSDFGIDNITEADGLAVGRPSRFVSRLMKDLVDGIFTFRDEEFFRMLYHLGESEGHKVEPSAAASLLPPFLVRGSNEKTVHLCWATGGSLVPGEIYKKMLARGRAVVEGQEFDFKDNTSY